VFVRRYGEGTNMDKESLEFLLARGLSVGEIARRFGKDPSTVSYWLKKHGVEAPNREKHAAKGGIQRERLVSLVELGLSIAEIAKEVGRSKGTVQYWLRRHRLRTRNVLARTSPERLRLAKEAGQLIVMNSCAHHGETEFFLEGRGYYRCKRCRSEAVARRRRKVKEILVAEAGGRCRLCGYDRSVAALEFHHLDPATKRMPLSSQGISYGIETLREEARKCVLLCGNCHAEVENGVVTVPATVGARLVRRGPDARVVEGYTVIWGSSTGRANGC
jgi:transposase-like protein